MYGTQSEPSTLTICCVLLFFFSTFGQSWRTLALGWWAAWTGCIRPELEAGFFAGALGTRRIYFFRLSLVGFFRFKGGTLGSLFGPSGSAGLIRLCDYWLGQYKSKCCEVSVWTHLYMCSKGASVGKIWNSQNPFWAENISCNPWAEYFL